MTDIVTLDEAKQYLRIDYDDEATTLTTLLQTAQVLVRDVARLSNDEKELLIIWTTPKVICAL